MNTLAPIYDGTQNAIPNPNQRLAFTLWIGMLMCLLDNPNDNIRKQVDSSLS